MELSAQRGAVLVDLDRPRILFYDMEATWKLIQIYGQRFAMELYEVSGKGADVELRLKSMDALAFFLWVGLQRDARDHGETLSLEDVTAQIRPYNYIPIFNAVVVGLAGTTNTPALPGKTAAAAPEAKPAAAVGAPRDRHPEPGPTMASTSPTRSASRSASSAGRRSGSGRPRSVN